MAEQDSPSPPVSSPPWNSTTRRTIAVVLIVLLLIIIWRFQGVLIQLLVAGLIAYLLSPLIDTVARRTPLSRGVATILVYVGLIVIGFAVITLIGVALYTEVNNLLETLPGLINDAVTTIGDLVNNPSAALVIGSYKIFSFADVDWQQVQSQVLGLLTPALRAGPGAAGQVASGAIGVVAWLVLTFVISLYMALDLPRMAEDFNHMALQSGYQEDFIRLKNGLVQIGNAYLRGQALLALTVGTLVGVSLALLGVQNALALGLVAGLAEFIPYFGPVISAIIAVLVSFFQATNQWGLNHFVFAVAALAVMILIQQIEANVLVPRIVGGALNLKPLTVIVALLIGGSLAGIFGIILAGPTAAAIKLVGGYIWRKLLGLPPWPDDTGSSHERSPSLVGSTLARFWRGTPVPPHTHTGVVEQDHEHVPPSEV